MVTCRPVASTVLPAGAAPAAPAAVLSMVDFLGSAELFGALERAQLRDLVSHLQPVHIGAGELLSDGDDEALYLVGSGRLEIGGVRGPAAARGAGQVIGAAPGGPVRAVRDSVVLRLSPGALAAFVRRHPKARPVLHRELGRLSAA